MATIRLAENTKSKSMTNIIQNWNVSQGIKLSSKNISGNDTVRNYPLYMAMFF